MMEDRQNTSFDGSGDDLLSDIPAAVVAGNEEHTAPPVGTASPSPAEPHQEEEHPQEEKKPRKAPPDTSVMKVGSFMGALVLLAIPIVNFVCAIKWIFRRGNNRNRRNLGIAALLLQLIFIGLVVGGCVIAKYQFNYDVIQHLLDFIFPK